MLWFANKREIGCFFWWTRGPKNFNKILVTKSDQFGNGNFREFHVKLERDDVCRITASFVKVWQNAKARGVCIWPGEVQQVQLGKAELTWTDLRTVELVQSIYDGYTKIPLTGIKGTACSRPTNRCRGD